MQSPSNSNHKNESGGAPAISFSYKSAVAQRESAKLPEAVKSCFLRRSSSQQEVERFDLQTMIVRSTFTGSVCRLCETRFKQEEMGGVGECGHEFCKRCLHDYLVYKISVMEEVGCPQEHCPVLLDTRTACFLDLPEDYRQRYARFLLWKQTISNPHLRLCPREDCEGVIDTRESFACAACGREFCGECMLARHEGACESNFERQFKEWQRCPSCRMFIEKTEGCNHMTCLCGHQFCFVCLADWQEKHYQCGSPADLFQGGLLRQYHFAEGLSRCQQLLVALLMLLLAPLLLLLAVGVLLLCVGLAAVLGALGGPCAVAVNTFSQDCCGPWFVILMVTLPIIMVVCALGAAVKILYEGAIILVNVVESYFSTICILLCPPEDPARDPFDEIF